MEASIPLPIPPPRRVDTDDDRLLGSNRSPSICPQSRRHSGDPADNAEGPQRVIYAEPDEESLYRAPTKPARIVYAEPDEMSLRNPTVAGTPPPPERVIYSEPDEMSLRNPTVAAAPAPSQRVIYAEPDEASLRAGDSVRRALSVQGEAYAEPEGASLYRALTKPTRVIYAEPDEASLYRGDTSAKRSDGSITEPSAGAGASTLTRDPLHRTLFEPEGDFGAKAASRTSTSMHDTSYDVLTDPCGSNDNTMLAIDEAASYNGGHDLRAPRRDRGWKHEHVIKSLETRVQELEARLAALEGPGGRIAALEEPRLIRTNISSKAEWENKFAYSRAVRKGPYIAVSGCTSVDWDTGVLLFPGDPYLQARQALNNIANALKALGASLSDVVRTRMFVHNMRDSAKIGEAHYEAFKDIRPAATMVEAKMINPKLLIEIEADAIVDDGGVGVVKLRVDDEDY